MLQTCRNSAYRPQSQRGVNRTAEWDDNLAARQTSGSHGVSFDDAQAEDVQLAYYFAIDGCAAHYIAIFQLDQRLGHSLKAVLRWLAFGALWLVQKGGSIKHNMQYDS